MQDNEILDDEFLNEIAIIGISGRFPGANNIDEFWKNLASGTESISFFSDEEMAEAGTDEKLINDPNFVKASGILDGPGMFDARFFGYSPREAQYMDPQHRLFLECAYEALEDAGYDSDRYANPIGVYGGTSMNTYLLFSDVLSNFYSENLNVLIGNDKDYLTTRVSHKLNLRGTSVNVQTACSTSLVAVHLACQSLLLGETDIALAGGVSVRVPHHTGYLYQEGNIYSPDGHCRAFDAGAQGTVFGSGVGIVVLKRLAEAIEDGDHIYAVIKGSALNNDGSSKVHYTAPSVNGQSEVVLQALANSGVDAGTIGYIEAHGTGTVLGDPIEITALTNAFRTHTDKNEYCAIGSVKTNIGHLDAAAGVVGLIKTALALENKLLPPSLNFDTPNPEIDFENSPFYVNAELAEWTSDQHPRRAGITSLGVGGTNAHVILEEAPVVEKSEKSRPWQLMLLSAKTKNALENATANLLEHLKQHPQHNLADIAYTLQVGRKEFEHRKAVIVRDHSDAVNVLETPVASQIITSRDAPKTRDVVFMFSGQGSQYVNMALDLYASEPTFRQQVDLCSEILEPHLGFDLRSVMYPDEATDPEEATEKLKQTAVTQPALFTIEYALAQLWMEWGIKPQALVGHSIGEYVAACLSGVLSLEDALALVAVRGRLMQSCQPGSMLIVMLPEEEVRPLTGETVALSVLNGPNLCVLSGEHEVIDDLERKLTDQDVQCRRLVTSHAFHSHMMEPILDEFIAEANKVQFNPPQIPFLSNVSGTWITAEEAMDPAYWAKHIRQTVRFSDNLHELSKDGDKILIEVGPGNTLASLAKQHPDITREFVVVNSMRHPKEDRSDLAYLLNTLGQLWLSGAEVDWSGFYADERRSRVSLPTYPFEHQNFWAVSNGKGISALSSGTTLSETASNGAEPLSETPERETLAAYEGAPRDEIERTIAKLWYELLGVEQVRIDDDFFDLGGSSLLAANLFTEINKKYGKNLPLATLFEAPTIEALANIVREGDWQPTWSSLVPIQQGDSKPPFFLIHAERGNIVGYHDLVSHLGKDLPVYGIQAQGLDGEPIHHDSIEDFAALYLKEIRAVQPQGPYYLGGYCLGGVLGWEMAKQLQRDNQEVALLVTMQNLHKDYPQYEEDTSSLQQLYHRLVDRIRYETSNFSKLDAKEKFSYIRQRGQRAVELVRDRTAGNDQTESNHAVNGSNGSNSTEQNQSGLDMQAFINKEVSQVYNQAFFRYDPKPYDGRILLFTSTNQPRGIIPDPTLGWGHLIKGEVDIYEIPSYHQTILWQPQVAEMAKIIRFHLDEVHKYYG